MGLFDGMTPEQMGWLQFANAATRSSPRRQSPIEAITGAYMAGAEGTNAAEAAQYQRSQQRMQMEEMARARQEAELVKRASMQAHQESDPYKNLLSQAAQFQRMGLQKQAMAAIQAAEKFKPKFKTDIRTELGPDGKPVTAQYDESGQRQVVSGSIPYERPMEMNLGGQVALVNPMTNQPQATFNKSISPDTQYSGGIAIRGQNMTDARSHESMKFQREQAANKPEKTMTDAQAKAYLFGNRMQEAGKVLDRLATGGVDQPSWMKQAAQSVPGVGPVTGAAANLMFASPQEQQVEQAQRDFINATLRRESGAVISDPEFANARQQYFPQPFDSSQVKEQKRRNRELATKAILMEVPRGTQSPMPSTVPGMPDMSAIQAELARRGL